MFFIQLNCDLTTFGKSVMDKQTAQNNWNLLRNNEEFILDYSVQPKSENEIFTVEA